MKTKEKKFKLKRIPILIFTFSLVLLTCILVFTIYFVISFKNAKIEPLLKEKFGYTNSVEIVEADSVGEDGYYSSSISGLKYSYSSKVDNLLVGLACKEYTPVSDANASGSISMYVGLKTLTTTASISVSSCKVLVAEKWSQYASNSSNVSSTYYSATYLGKEKITFSSKSISVTEDFPQKFLLGMHKVSHPNVYVYVSYKDKNESKEVVIEFEFDDYFINGQSTVNA